MTDYLNLPEVQARACMAWLAGGNLGGNLGDLGVNLGVNLGGNLGGNLGAISVIISGGDRRAAEDGARR